MDKRWDVMICGDVNIDLVVPGVAKLPAPGSEEDVSAMETFVGGGAALFALGAAKLGLKTVFQGSVGADMYGAYIRRVFRETSVDDALLADHPAAGTGISISFTTAQDRCFLTYRGTNADLSLDNLNFEALAQARHIHITGYAGERNHEEYDNALKKIKALGGVTVSFDVGWDDTGLWYAGIFDLLPMIDVLFMNETECLHYTRCQDVKEGARRLAEQAGMAVVKLGKKGALAVRQGREWFVPGFTVQAVDTTGAGDSFNAGFVYGYLNGLPVEECLRRGNGCGALSVTALGGNTAFPWLSELEEWLANSKKGE